MTEKRFTLHKGLDTISIMDNTKFREQIYINKSSKDMKCLVELLNKLAEENKKFKLQNEELLYQIGEVGKNNKTCRKCECFIPEIKYCYMWDMEVEADDVVVACDQRKVKNVKEMISDD